MAFSPREITRSLRVISRVTRQRIVIPELITSRILIGRTGRCDVARAGSSQLINTPVPEFVFAGLLSSVCQITTEL